MTHEPAPTITVKINPGAALELLFPWGNESANRDILEQILDLDDDHDREIAGALVEFDSSCPFSRILDRIWSDNPDPTLGDIAENAVTNAAGPRHDWTNPEHYRHVVRLMIDEYRDDFARYDARRCAHTTKAGNRCKNRAAACPAHGATP